MFAQMVADLGHYDAVYKLRESRHIVINLIFFFFWEKMFFYWLKDCTTTEAEQETLQKNPHILYLKKSEFTVFFFIIFESLKFYILICSKSRLIWCKRKKKKNYGEC